MILQHAWHGFKESREHGFNGGILSADYLHGVAGAARYGDLAPTAKQIAKGMGRAPGPLLSPLGRVGQAAKVGIANPLKSAFHLSFAGQALFSIPLAGLAAGAAPRGHKVSAGVSAMSMGVGSFVGGLLLGTPGALIGGFVGDEVIGERLGGMLQRVKDSSSTSRRLNMGGDYQDSQAAYTMRQAAAQEMSGSLMNARQYLGNESAMMHS